MLSVPKKDKIIIFDEKGQIVETYFEVSDKEFFEKLNIYEEKISEQADRLRTTELGMYGSGKAHLLKFEENDLNKVNKNSYPNQKSTMTMIKRAVEAYLNAEEPIKEFDKYLEDASQYFMNVANYIDCLNSTIEEDMKYFVSDKDNMRAIAKENVPMAKQIMNAEHNEEYLDTKAKEKGKEKVSTYYI